MDLLKIENTANKIQLIEPSISVNEIDADRMLRSIESAGRTCYKSHEAETKEVMEKFVTMLIRRGHESVLEHESISVRIITDRGVSHEIVRHRIASYSQESTRYCNYTKKEIKFINPTFELEEDDQKFLAYASAHYAKRIKQGLKPEEARYFLPSGLKTELVMTCNLREWRYFLKLRITKYAHPQMRQIANMILKEFKILLPCVFKDIKEN